VQANYTWSKVIGEEEGAAQELIDSYRTLRNRSLDKRLLAFNRTHIIRTNGTYEFPIGKGKPVGGNMPLWLNHIVGGWRGSWIFNLFSGEPLSITGAGGTFNTFGDNTPDVNGDLPKSIGVVERQGAGVQYLAGYKVGPDPYVTGITNINNIRGRSNLYSIQDPSGKTILVNSAPGTLGTLGPAFLSGPGSFRLDVNLIKRFPIYEGVNMELRADAIDVANKPDFGSPNTSINSLDFGRITSAAGNRIVVISVKVNF
jgi:hypothetical protein